MSGWNLNEEKYIKENISEDEIWAILNNVFSPKSYKTTTYKFCFLKCLLDNIFNLDENYCIGFDKIYLRFAEVYWNLVVKHRLCQIQVNSQWSKSSVELILDKFLKKYNLDNEVAFEGLKENIQLELAQSIGYECSKYVIGAFFCDTKQLFYSFSKKTKLIIFNPCVYTMFVKYKHIIEKLNYFEWIKFLEKVNPSETVYALAEKLDYSAKRSNLSSYRNYLFDENKKNLCFYCKKLINISAIEVDHYIPWSFVKDDKMWNFVLSCRECNNKKRDKLTSEIFISKLVDRNILLLSTKSDLIIKNDFKGYNNSKIESMYKSAVFNGFDYGWEPKRV